MSLFQNDPFAAAMAAQVAREHAQPLWSATFPLLIAIAVISIFVLVRWSMSKDAWPYHPGGARGFLMDEIKRYASIWLPFAVVMVCVRYYIYKYHPEIAASPYFYVGYLSIIIFRRLARLLPHVQEIGRRIDKARADARAAKQGARV